ncbi:MAG: DMT family transporter [Alistipes sp.]
MTPRASYRYHLIAIFTVAVWGTTFVSTKILINNGLTPAEIFFMRFLLAYICIWAVAPRRLWSNSVRDEATLLAAGVCGGSLYFLTENMALEYAPASNVSLLVCTAPLWTSLLLSAFHRDERMSRRQIVGSSVAFAGMVLVVLNGHFILQLSPQGDLLALSAALLWALYSLIIKGIGTKYPNLFLTRKIFFYGLLTILPFLLLRQSTFDIALLAPPVVWLNLLFLGFVASMLCYLLWNISMQHLGAVRATNYIYINPLVTIITATLCLNEQITIAALAGAALILMGMWQAER